MVSGEISRGLQFIAPATGKERGTAEAGIARGIAPRAVLLVLPGIGAGKIDDALAARGKPAGDAGNAGSALLGTSSSIADLTGRVFTIRARARIGDAAEFMRSIVVRFSDGATGSFWIQDWSDGA